MAGEESCKQGAPLRSKVYTTGVKSYRDELDRDERNNRGEPETLAPHAA